MAYYVSALKPVHGMTCAAGIEGQPAPCMSSFAGRMPDAHCAVDQLRLLAAASNQQLSAGVHGHCLQQAEVAVSGSVANAARGSAQHRKAVVDHVNELFSFYMQAYLVQQVDLGCVCAGGYWAGRV